MNWIGISLSLIVAISWAAATRKGFDYASESEDICDASTYVLSKSNPIKWEKSFQSRRVNENDINRVLSTEPSPRILKVSFEKITSRKYLKISSNDSGVTVETDTTKSHHKQLKEVDYADVQLRSLPPTLPSDVSSTFKQMNATKTFCPKEISSSRSSSSSSTAGRLATNCFVMKRKLKLSSRIFNGRAKSLYASFKWELLTELRQTGEYSVYRTKHVESISEHRTADNRNISTVEKVNEKFSYYPKVVANSRAVNVYVNSGKWHLTADNQQKLSCLNETLRRVERECSNDAVHWYEIWTAQNLPDCVAQFGSLSISIEILKEKTWDVEEYCQAIQKKQIRQLYSDCVITKSGALDENRCDVDLNVFIDGHITASQLTKTQKSKALAQFQSCVEFESSNSQMIVDCMNSALLQNDCASGDAVHRQIVSF